MARKPSVSDIMTVTDPKTGRVLILRGTGSNKVMPLDLDKRIDLTKPILEQVIALEETDKAS
jgi:hypothetical protein